MNSTAPTKPVMDVALPKRPVSAPAHTVRKQTAATASVTPAPRKPLAPAPRTRMTKDTSAAARRSDVPQQQAAPVAQQPAPAAGQVQRGLPVALITVTVFVILILSVLAVTLYVTSQVA